MIVNSSPGEFLADWASINAAAAYRELTGAKTMTTEELKREMYKDLDRVGSMVRGTHLYETFQSSLEGYLEALRLDRVKFTEERRGELEHRLAAMTDERDELRNKLQAFEFANRSAGEFLQEARAKVARQRQSIGQLKNERDNARNLAGANYTKYQKARQELSELRKILGSTIAQNRKENPSESICVALPGRSSEESLFISDHLGETKPCGRCGGSGLETSPGSKPCYRCHGSRSQA